jgi:membrane protease YdiL (CAAX protease family)
VRVAAFSVAAAAAFAAADALLISPAAGDDDARLMALVHLAREGALAALLPSAVWLALKPDLDRSAAKAAEAGGAAPRPFRLAAWLPSSTPDSYNWATQALITAAVAFPLAELIGAAVDGAFPRDGGGADLAAAVRAAAASGDRLSVAAHAFASGALAPIWEEVFWRGFFVASLARVVLLAKGAKKEAGLGVVAASAIGFSALHLSPRAAPSLALLGACCDLLYLRSGGNLAGPLLFHGLWNTGQVLLVAAGVKDTFL